MMQGRNNFNICQSQMVKAIQHWLRSDVFTHSYGKDVKVVAVRSRKDDGGIHFTIELDGKVSAKEVRVQDEG